MRRGRQSAPHPADPPTPTNTHTNASPPLWDNHAAQRGECEMVAEAGTANRAFAKGGRCPNRQATPLNQAPGLHPSDEPLLLCETSLVPLIGRRPTLSTPQPRNFPGSAGKLVKRLSVTQADSTPAHAPRRGPSVKSEGLQEGEQRIGRPVAARLAVHGRGPASTDIPRQRPRRFWRGVARARRGSAAGPGWSGTTAQEKLAVRLAGVRSWIAAACWPAQDAAPPEGQPLHKFATMPRLVEETRCILSPGSHGFPGSTSKSCASY
jgi:hypothetical protein